MRGDTHQSRLPASGSTLTQDEADQALEQLVAEGDRIAANLIDLSGVTGEQPPEGVTAARWQETKTKAELLWSHYDAYRGVLQRARAVRSRRDELEPAELAELNELLNGAAVELAGASGDGERVSMAVAVQRMDAAYKEVTAVAGAGLALHVDPADTVRQPARGTTTRSGSTPPEAAPHEAPAAPGRVRPSRAERHGRAGGGQGAAQPPPDQAGGRPLRSGQPGPQPPGGQAQGGAVEWFHGPPGAAPRGASGGDPRPLGPRRQPGSSFAAPEGEGVEWFHGVPDPDRPPQPGDSPLSRALQRRGTSGPMFPPPGRPGSGEGPAAQGQESSGEEGERKRPGGLKAMRARIEAGGVDGLRRIQEGLKAARSRIDSRSTGNDEHGDPDGHAQPGTGPDPQAGPHPANRGEGGPREGFQPRAGATLPDLSPPRPAAPGPAAPAQPARPATPQAGKAPGEASGWIEQEPPTAYQPPPRRQQERAQPRPAQPRPAPQPPSPPPAGQVPPQQASPRPSPAGQAPPDRGQAPAAREAAPGPAAPAQPSPPASPRPGTTGGEPSGWIEPEPRTTFQPPPRRQPSQEQPKPAASKPSPASQPAPAPQPAARPAKEQTGGRTGGDERIDAVRALLAKVEQSTAAQRALQAEVTAKIASPSLPEVADLQTLRDRVTALAAGQPSGGQALARELTAVVRDLNAALESSRAAVSNAAGLLERRRELRGRLDAYRAKAKRLGRSKDPLLAECHRRALELLRARPCDLRAATKAVTHYQRVLSDDSSGPDPSAGHGNGTGERGASGEEAPS